MPRFTTILFLGILCLFARASAADRIDGFANLASEDVLQMRFTSEGCYGGGTYDLTFTRTTNSTASVVIVRAFSFSPRESYPTTQRLALSDADLAGLDTLLAFYRTNSVTGCTTKDDIVISQVRSGKVIASEGFTDASCESYAIKGVLTVGALRARLSEKKEKK